jgi:hypothetical protein
VRPLLDVSLALVYPLSNLGTKPDVHDSGNDLMERVIDFRV